MIPGADLNDLPRAVELSEKYPQIYFAVGVHPYDCDGYDQSILEKYVNHPKCIAVGECGLDYYRLPQDKEEKESVKLKQKEIFIAQIEFAKKFKKPLIIHIRDASNDSKHLLIEHNAKDVGGVLHCYNADEQLLSLSGHNFYFGIGGVLTFKNAKKLLHVLPKIPKDKIVVETDAPYLTPHPHRGKRNEPKYTVLVVEKIAQLLEMSVDEAKSLTTTNALRLFKEISIKNQI